MPDKQDDSTQQPESPETPARQWPTSLANPKRYRRP